MKTSPTVAEADLYDSIKTRLLDIDDWITVEDFLLRTELRNCGAMCHEWDLTHREVMMEGIGRLVEQGIIEFKLDENNEGMIKYTYSTSPESVSSSAYDRVFTKYRLAKLEDELKDIKQKLSLVMS